MMSGKRYYHNKRSRDLINVWVVEDHTQIRDTVVDILSERTDMECLVSVGSMEEVLLILKQKTQKLPDVVLLDLGLPGLGGLEGIPLIKGVVPECKVIVFTVFGDEQKTMEALRSGADGYLLKDEQVTQIPEFIQQSVKGGAPISAPASRHVFDSYRLNRQWEETSTDDIYKLSANESNILKLVSNGMVKKDISEALGISYHRIDYYMRRIFKKLNVRNVHGAVGKAMREGIIER